VGVYALSTRSDSRVGVGRQRTFDSRSNVRCAGQSPAASSGWLPGEEAALLGRGMRLCTTM